MKESILISLAKLMWKDGLSNDRLADMVDTIMDVSVMDHELRQDCERLRSYFVRTGIIMPDWPK